MIPWLLLESADMEAFVTSVMVTQFPRHRPRPASQYQEENIMEPASLESTESSSIPAVLS